MTAACDAAAAASLFAVDPVGLGGVCLRSMVQPARTDWLQMLRELLPEAPMRRIPFNISDGRLLGGLDLVATLRANRPMAERGVLAAADGGVVIVAMAERLSAHTAACLNAVLDCGEISLQREGLQINDSARIGVVAMDESMQEDEQVAASLLDRMAFLVDLNDMDRRSALMPLHDAAEILAARKLLPQVTISDGIIGALCATAMTLGAGSPRVSLLAVNAARAAAALDGRTAVSSHDATLSGRLVFAPRATQMPSADDAPPEEFNPGPSQGNEQSQPQPQSQSQSQPESQSRPALEGSRDELEDVVLAATQAAVPAGLLASLQTQTQSRVATTSAGRVGVARNGGARGRPSGVRSGAPQGSSRLNILETLRAAAPWQRLRGRTGLADARLRIQASDFRVTRYRQRTQTLTIFAVDASGSAALNRLAEAKGAVEYLLSDCYVRRDHVAVVTFRGRGADILLSPTRSLTRAKRGLAGLPGGGGTPLAAGIQCAMELANLALRRGETPTIVILTDGRANVARSGVGGREAAQADAMRAAQQLHALRIAVLFVDTSPRPNLLAQTLATAMKARYIPLPFASAKALSSLVQTVAREV